MTTAPTRYVAARLHAPAEPGTILGPRDITGDYLVVLDDGISVSYATLHDVRTALETANATGPRSVTEHRLLTRGYTR